MGSLVKVILPLFAGMLTLVSCTSYDEQDITIIAYLRINDLIEKNLSQSSQSELKKFAEDYDDHQAARMSDFLGIASALGVNAYANDEYLNYNQTSIEALYNRYYDEAIQDFHVDLLEAGVTSELWAYLNLLYADVIPAKAQNVEEGRYYTISELKEKYPGYSDVELEDFSPMELINTVMNEKLFGPVLLSDGEVNLRTLYIYYIHYKEITEGMEEDIDDIGYLTIIDSHFPDGIPDDFDVDKIIELFQKLSTGDSPMYANDLTGFESFANDYFETDMFTGEDF